MELFSLVFSGNLADGIDPAQAKKSLCDKLKLTPAQVEKLFSGKRITVKKDLTLDKANKIQSVFLQCGAIAQLSPQRESGSSSVSAAKNQWSIDSRAKLELQPKVETTAVAVQQKEEVPVTEEESLEEEAVNSRSVLDLAWSVKFFFPALAIIIIGIVFMSLYHPGTDLRITRGFILGLTIFIFGGYRVINLVR